MSNKTYTDIHGNKHSLIKEIIKRSEWYRTRDMDKKVMAKAIDMANDTNKDIFWCLKEYDDINGGFKQAQYFLIPIDRSEVKKIINEFHSDHWIGIKYRPDDSTIADEAPIEFETTKTGYDYEQECAYYLEEHGFVNVSVTPKSGDQGIDVIAYKDCLKYGFQCKYYQGTVPNKAVQEAYAGAKFYDCNIAVVMTTGTFSKSTIELGHKLGVKLWTSDPDY